MDGNWSIDESAALGFSRSRSITREYAKSFYFVSRFLPRGKRYASYSLYAICRATDEAVDCRTDVPSRENLAKVKESIDSVYSDSRLESDLLRALRITVNQYRIPKHYFSQLLEGVYMDLNKKHYENFNELYSYCYHVAGVIGLMMLKIFGSQDPRAERHAVNLGIAMQLTNILRDIKEDYERGRIYLPRDEMEHFRVSESHISEENLDESFKALLRFNIRRAREYYANARPGIRMIDNARSRFVVCAMKEIYAGILYSIENNDYDIFSQRAHVNFAGKVRLALITVLRGEYLKT